MAGLTCLTCLACASAPRPAAVPPSAAESSAAERSGPVDPVDPVDPLDPLDPVDPVAPATELGAAAGPHAAFELSGWDGRERQFDWSQASNLVSCRHDPEPERGDYLWIRFGETREQDGDAGVRLDIDVCRLSALDGGLPVMPAGQHGSHCAPSPGFAIWWHDGDAAYNTGAAVDPSPCTLELDYDRDHQTLRGRFECATLQPAAEPGAAAGSDATIEHGRELALAAGSFECEVEPMRPAS